MDCERMVEKGINFIFCLGTAYYISSMESVGNYSVVFVDGKSMPLKFFYLSIFSLSSGTSTNPYFPLRRAYLFTLCNFFIWFSILSYKAPTREHYDHTWALYVANMRVCFINGPIIEHDGVGITLLLPLGHISFTLCSIIDPFMKHTRILATPNAQVRS